MNKTITDLAEILSENVDFGYLNEGFPTKSAIRNFQKATILNVIYGVKHDNAIKGIDVLMSNIVLMKSVD